MAWGRSYQSYNASTLSKVIPLVILVFILAVVGYIGYHVYLSAQQIGESASQRMNRKNVVWTRDGVKVGVKSFKNEKYVDKTQSWVVKAWNLAKSGSPEETEASKKKNK
ncbi:hypothetical protein ACO1O0_007364 [Amphichorda felina]